MSAAASISLPVLLILIFAAEQGGFKMRPVELAKTAAPTGLTDLNSLKGSFKATFTGSRRGVLTGEALLMSEQANGMHVHNMALFACENEASCRVIQFSRLHEQLPQKGTYALDDVDAGNDVQALYYEVNDGELTQLCGPSGGWLKITRSESDRIAGTFEFTAEGMVGRLREGGEPFQVRISGSFEAQRGDARDLPAGLQLKR